MRRPLTDSREHFCRHCGGLLPRRRLVYCSRACKSAGLSARWRNRTDARFLVSTDFSAEDVVDDLPPP